MKVGIVCAGDDELAPFLPIVENCKIIERTRLKFYEGQIHGMEVEYSVASEPLNPLQRAIHSE